MTPGTDFSWEKFQSLPLVGILRRIGAERLAGILGAVQEGGLTTVEITMDAPDAAAQIRRAREIANGQLNVGAGTVTCLRRLDDALAAGASFIVTPTVQVAVIAACVKRGVPIFPGALSPTEVRIAAELGANLVKVFPADGLGPDHIRHLKDVMPDVGLMPTGGVDLATLAGFREAGADAFGVGSPLFDRRRIEAGEWEWLKRRCAAFREAFEAASA